MSWEEILKDLRSRATSPEAMATRIGSGNYSPVKTQIGSQHPEMQTAPKADCKVRTCSATSCLHNRDKKCTLPSITIKPDGGCEQFKKD